MHRNNLIIFLKFPEPGKVKTRLGKEIGYDKAAELYSVFTNYLISQLEASDYFEITIQYSPSERKNEIYEWLKKENMREQIGSNLGEKISEAFDTSFSRGHKNSIVIGTDCIELTCKDIENAFNFIDNEYDSVIGPTNDGGYYLVGLCKKNCPEIFNDIEWSTDKVFDQTIEKINKWSLKNKILNYYNDIDEISDINSNVIKIINDYNPGIRIQN